MIIKIGWFKNSTKYGINSFSYYATKHWIALPDNSHALAGTKEFASRVHGVKF